jgi:beta-xylosidase
MPITKVSYAKLFNLGDYQNHRIEAEADVDTNHGPEDVLAVLTEWVEEQHAEMVKPAQELDDLRKQIAQCRSETWKAEKLSREAGERLQRNVTKVRQLAEILKAHGVETPDLDEWLKEALSRTEPEDTDDEDDYGPSEDDYDDYEVDPGEDY